MDTALGALWSKQGRRGEYLTGVIEGRRVVAFRVEARGPNSPTWRVYLATTPSPPPPLQPNAGPDDEDVPF